MTPSSLASLPFDRESLHRAWRDGMSVDAFVAELVRRIDAADDPGIFIERFDAEEIAASFAALGSFDPVLKPLWGLPFVVKDNIDVAGHPTTAGCPAFAFDPPNDAFVVAALRRAGAVAIGKTNLDQFATGLVGTRTPYPVPRNAWDPALVPGGSSSGSAVAVARGLATFALGTDTAGSGRVPAALNGIVGLKPSLGVLSGIGVVPACRSLDTVSVFARSVGDAWHVLVNAAAHDPQDPYARPLACVPPPAAAWPATIGIPDRASLLEICAPATVASFDACIARLKAHGHRVREIEFTPFHQVAAMLYSSARIAERLQAPGKLLEHDPAALHPVTREVLSSGADYSAADAFAALDRLRELTRRCIAAMASTDCLCVPSVPDVCTLAQDEAEPVAANSRLGAYTNFVNLLDMCALSLPAGARADGMPASITFIAAAGRDATLAALGAAWERPDPAAELVIAVVGAHLSGMPLNHELTRLGARLVRPANTAPKYRLYALAGGPPARPGLVRGSDGAAIALELWALPSARVGEFLAGIPMPLGLGTLELDDGERVKGFICEPAALAGATDVTRFGGWRAYVASLSRGAAPRSP